VNPNLKSHIEDLVNSLSNPEMAKELIRGIADRCLNLILKHEFPAFPDALIDPEWSRIGSSRASWQIQRMTVIFSKTRFRETEARK